MDVFVFCEFSDTVSAAFRERGHNVLSCDLLPSENPDANHLQGDGRHLLREPWDLVIAHPPCQKLTAVNDCFTNNFESATWEQDYGAAVSLFIECRAANAPLVAVENPVMHRRARLLLGKADCVVNPFDFGSPFRKRTGFWLMGLPPLMSTLYRPNPAYWVQWRSQIKGGKYLAKDRGSITSGHRNSQMRSRFHPEMAAAMAQQWG